MQKVLEIIMEEECTTCPNLEMTTEKWDVGTIAEPRFVLTHECSHLDFCKTVRKNWEEWQAIRKGGKGVTSD